MNKQHAEKSEYQESNRKNVHKHYWSKKDEKFPPNPPSNRFYVSKLCLIFVLILSPEVFDQAIGYSVGKIDVFSRKLLIK